MENKKYQLIMTYQYTGFNVDERYEKTKTLDFLSDDVKELADILTKYISKFLTKDKKSNVWMFFDAEIIDQTKTSYDLEKTVYIASLERKD